VSRQRALQWGRTAWTLALLFGSLPVAGRLFLGVWEFEGAAGLACLCLLAGIYFHILGRRAFTLPDSATMLDRAIRLASSGQTDEAIALLTAAIRLSPRCWQAFQYRGELQLMEGKSLEPALEDLTQAIRLAPGEAHLYVLRGQAYSLLGDHVAAARDNSTATTLTRRDQHVPW